MELGLEIPFETEKSAEIAYNSLRVDPEPKRSGLVKTLELKGATLVVHFKCQEARTLRVSVNTFFDLLSLVIQTQEQFAI